MTQRAGCVPNKGRYLCRRLTVSTYFIEDAQYFIARQVRPEYLPKRSAGLCDRFIRVTRPTHPDNIDARNFVSPPDDGKWRRIIGERYKAPDEGQKPNLDKLMNGGVSTDDDSVFYDRMPAETDIVDQRHIRPGLRIMPHVRVDHQESPVSKSGRLRFV